MEAKGPLPDAGVPLMRFASEQGPVSIDGAAHGFTARQRARLLGRVRMSPPSWASTTTSFGAGFRPRDQRLFRVPSPSPAAALSGRRRYLPGFRFLFAGSSRVGSSSSAVTSSGFFAPRRIAHHAISGLAPTPRPGFSVQGFLPARSHAASSAAVAPLPL